METWDNLRKADINEATSGDRTIIAAPSSGYIVIDHINFVVASAVDIQLKDGSTNYGGLYGLAANQSVVLENTMQNHKGVITLTPVTAFVMNLSANVQTSGFVRYRVVV